MQQLLPGETLRVAIAGQVGPSFASAVLMGFGASLVQHGLVAASRHIILYVSADAARPHL
jgi:hypothetical protein